MQPNMIAKSQIFKCSFSRLKHNTPRKKGEKLMNQNVAIFSAVFIVFIVAAGLAAFIIETRNPSQHEENFSVVVTDALGRTVQINLPIERVIITGKSGWPITSVAYMFPSAENRLYGLSPQTASIQLFRMVDPAIDSKTSSDLGSNSPNIEELAAANPDVVILKTSMKNQIGDPLEALGINVVYVDFENLDSYVRDVKVIGKIFENAAKADEIAEYYEEKYDNTLSKTASLVTENRPKVLLLYYNAQGGTVSFNAPGAGWLQTSMIDAAGGYALSNELAGTGWNTISFEQIAQWDPDIIFTVTYSGNPSASSVKDNLLADSTWTGITAVKNGKVYAVPHDCSNIAAIGSWDNPCSRWILGQLWMAKKIQPSLFANLDLAEEAKEFYMRWYGLDENNATTIVNQITGDLQ